MPLGGECSDWGKWLLKYGEWHSTGILAGDCSALSPEPPTPGSPHMSLVYCALFLPEPHVSSCKWNFVCWPWIDSSTKRTYKGPIDIWKDAQCHQLSDKYKLKPQWDTTSHQSEWLSSVNKQTACADKDVEKGEPFCTIGGEADWCSHCGKQYGDMSKN